MYREELIDRRSRLEIKDSLSSYNGWTAQQNPHAFEAFFNLLSTVRPKQILEIGTALGGLTCYLDHMSKELQNETHLISYDVHGRYNYPQLRNQGIDQRVENIFTPNYSGLAESSVEEFIKRNGTTLVLCDGGNKVKEFNILSQYLKVGDVIMAHDYAFNREVFLNEINGVLWNWHEISESDIANACETHNLQPFMQDTFGKAVWVCKVKE